VEAEEALDESWAEPPVFGGCSTKGQARPGDPQPIQILRNKPHPGVVSTAGPSQGANNAPSGGSVAAPAASVGVVLP